MSWFNIITKPTLMVIWSICIVLSLMDIYYIKNMEKNWSFYDNQFLESKVWWLCGIPLCVYSLVIEISLMILTLFSYKGADSEFETEDLDKEYRSYNSNYNYNYSNLYDNAEEYTWSALSWIDNISLCNRLIFLITNFLAMMTVYYIYVGLVEYQTKSLTFLIKSGIIFTATVLTWIPGVLNSFIESLKLFGIVSGCSLVLILLLCSRNYQNSNNVSKLTSEVLNINKLSKGEEIVNKRIIERYIESGGKYYTISSSPAAIATELYWGNMAMKTLKENKSYIDCDFNLNNNKWSSCIEEKITSYPSWVIGDKTISGIIEPVTIAHMVNINIKELKEEVLSLVHPDEKKEIEKKISDFIPNNYDEEDETNSNNDSESKVVKKIDEDDYPFVSKNKNKKIGKRYKKNKKTQPNNRKTNEENKNDDEESLVNSIYEQPLFRGINALNKLESNDEDHVVNKNLINENIESPRNDDEKNEFIMELPSKQEFNEFNNIINNLEKKHIEEMQQEYQNADIKLDKIENELNDQSSDGEVVGDVISERVDSDEVVDNNNVVELDAPKDDQITSALSDEVKITEINDLNIDEEKQLSSIETKDETFDDVNTDKDLGSDVQNIGNFASEMIQTDEENN
ncbi:thioredoxin PDI [Cryptosporidium xiaoi]|uniref:Thioredoxin PDI n=1 Tax=Cryptosporidium xiaoi TaxID=659607 RepID=A0AAV9XXN6_9CRYT